MIVWIPAFCTLFPGTFGYDAPIQLMQWLGDLKLNDQHPITHTVMIGLLYDFGTKILGGSPNTGIAIYTVVQGLIVSASIAYGLLVLRRFGASAIEIILSFIWISFNPFIQSLTFSITKDILFGAFLSVFLFILWQCLWNGKWDKKTAVAFIVFGILTCLFRHQGVYFFAALLLFLIVAPKSSQRKKKSMTIAVVIVIATFEVFGFVCHTILGIKPGDTREMLSVPIQQMAYVCKQKIEGQPINVTDEQLSQVESFIPESGILAYQPDTADPVKTTFDTDAFTSNLLENSVLYLKLGLKNPFEYSYVFRNMTEGYIDSDEMEHMGFMLMNTFDSFYNIDIHRSPILFEQYYDFLVKDTLDSGYQRVPLMGILYKPSMCIWLLFLILGIIVYRRDYDLWLVTIPILLQFISLLLGPVALLRYLYPIMLLVPFMFVSCINNRRAQRD
ncbi:MAG: DUF6020 family protein [Saccharofermentans sp.]|nr:DUF6020 family protein [Saccharofermentans sp.]